MKIIKTRYFILTVLFALQFSLFAQNDSLMKFSLSQAQDYAVNNFFVTKNAQLDIEKAKKVVMETTAIGLPQVKASANYVYIPGEIPTMDFIGQIGELILPVYRAHGYDTTMFSNMGPSPIAARNSTTYGFTVSQLIFSGEYIVGLQASKTYKSLTEEICEKTEISIKQSVADSYFSILILESNKLILEQTLSNIKQVYNQVRKSYEAGLMEDTEADQLNLTMMRTENDLKTLETQIELLHKFFKYLIGLDSEYNVELTDNLDALISLNLVNDTTYSFFPDDNIDYRMLETQEKLMSLSLKRERSKYLPTVAGFYQYQGKTNKADLDFTLPHIIGVSVEVPIFQSGTRMARSGQAKIELEKARNVKEQETSRLKMESEQAILNYRTACEKYKNEKLNYELSEKVYKKTTEKHKAGFVSSLELTLINNQFLQAQLSYSMAIQELLNSKVALDKAYNNL